MMIVGTNKAKKYLKNIYFFLLLFMAPSCVMKQGAPYTKVSFVPTTTEIEEIKTPFTFLEEKKEKVSFEEELFIGDKFLEQKDLYQAIVSFKRAKFLAPPKETIQRNIDYKLLTTYFIGGKYQDAINTYEQGPLFTAPSDYPYLTNTLIMVTASYEELNLEAKKERSLFLLNSLNEEKAKTLLLYQEVQNQDFCRLEHFPNFLSSYQAEKKSPEKAAFLNGICPGMGFFYVGQKEAALTSFIINTLFTLGAVELFQHGYPALGVIVTSLELGWYVGGINGAYLAAKEYNNALYQKKSSFFLRENKVFPLLFLEKRF